MRTKCIDKVRYQLGDDYTCMMKGYLIDSIKKDLINESRDSFIIDFGGDMYLHNVKDRLINIEGTNFNIKLSSGSYSIFTSGNTKKRGDHIIGGNLSEMVTLVVEEDCSVTS